MGQFVSGSSGKVQSSIMKTWKIAFRRTASRLQSRNSDSGDYPLYRSLLWGKLMANNRNSIAAWGRLLAILLLGFCVAGPAQGFGSSVQCDVTVKTKPKPKPKSGSGGGTKGTKKLDPLSWPRLPL